MHKRAFFSFIGIGVSTTALSLGCSSSEVTGSRGSAQGTGASVGNTGGAGAAASGGSDAGLGGAPGSGVGGFSADGSAASGNGGSPGAGGSTVGSGGSGTGAGGTFLNFGGGGNLGGGETQCDGLDDDNNGIIDDVDIGGDGICDCLNIATIGRLGLWGSGNLFTDWINSRSPKPATALGDQVLTNVNLAQFQVIVILNVATYQTQKKRSDTINHPYSPEESAALAAWVQNGGGLMTTIGNTETYDQEIMDIGRLLQAVDVGYDPTNGWVVDGNVTKWVQHPITQGIMSVFTDRGAPPTAGSGLTPLGWDPLGHVALSVKDFGSGHIAMWGDEWITYDKLWTNQATWQVERFWLNLFKWLSPPTFCQVPIPPTVF